jgi:hypothetical protein
MFMLRFAYAYSCYFYRFGKGNGGLCCRKEH